MQAIGSGRLGCEVLLDVRHVLGVRKVLRRVELWEESKRVEQLLANLRHARAKDTSNSV